MIYYFTFWRASVLYIFYQLKVQWKLLQSKVYFNLFFSIAFIDWIFRCVLDRKQRKKFIHEYQFIRVVYLYSTCSCTSACACMCKHNYVKLTQANKLAFIKYSSAAFSRMTYSFSTVSVFLQLFGRMGPITVKGCIICKCDNDIRILQMGINEKNDQFSEWFFCH